MNNPEPELNPGAVININRDKDDNFVVTMGCTDIEEAYAWGRGEDLSEAISDFMSTWMLRQDLKAARPPLDAVSVAIRLAITTYYYGKDECTADKNTIGKS